MEPTLTTSLPTIKIKLMILFLAVYSRFAKNLSHDQIQLSTLKGEGELKNLELNEEVLTELLELPSWLRLSGATCNRVAVRIQWTKLKSVPIHLSLDEVRKSQITILQGQWSLMLKGAHLHTLFESQLRKLHRYFADPILSLS